MTLFLAAVKDATAKDGQETTEAFDRAWAPVAASDYWSKLQKQAIKTIGAKSAPSLSKPQEDAVATATATADDKSKTALQQASVDTVAAKYARSESATAARSSDSPAKNASSADAPDRRASIAATSTSTPVDSKLATETQGKYASVSSRAPAASTSPPIHSNAVSASVGHAHASSTLPTAANTTDQVTQEHATYAPRNRTEDLTTTPAVHERKAAVRLPSVQELVQHVSQALDALADVPEAAKVARKPKLHADANALPRRPSPSIEATAPSGEIRAKTGGRSAVRRSDDSRNSVQKRKAFAPSGVSAASTRLGQSTGDGGDKMTPALIDDLKQLLGELERREAARAKSGGKFAPRSKR